MNVLFVASEVFPLIKTGGLADVAGALPIALQQNGVNVRVLLPNYPGLESQLKRPTTRAVLGNPFGYGNIHLIEGLLEVPGGAPDIHIWLLDCKELYHREGGPYLNPKGEDYEDNERRFGVFSWAAAMLAAYGAWQTWRPDIVHAHDWQAGLVAAYLKSWGFHKIPVVFTIHNVQYTGIFDPACMDELKLAPELFHIDGLEFYGQLSMLKAGIQFSDWVTTVSPTYAQEIQSQDYGCGLEGVLRKNRHKLSGILNGVDYSTWNPNTDPLIDTMYSHVELEKKVLNKTALQSRFHMKVDPSAMLFGAVSRLTDQKGLDLALEVMPDLLQQGSQLVLLGSGASELEQGFLDLANQYPDRVAVTIGYNEALSHQIQAASDALLIPSRFEPCGLTQLYALKYGTLPIVRKTGGLADTIQGSDQPQQTGFVFSQASSDSLKKAMWDAKNVYANKPLWRKMQIDAMAQNYSWKRSASEYRSLYQRLLS